MTLLPYRLIRALASAILVFASASVLAQTSLLQEPAGSVADGGLLQPGIVVAKVEQGYQGQRAGLRAGDVLLSWSRGDDSGEFASPFDFIKVDLDQRPLAPVTLHGLRGNDAQSWTLASTTWGIETEPHFRASSASAQTGAARTVNPDGTHLEFASDPKMQSQIPWLRSWLLLHRANVRAKSKRWKEAEGDCHEAFDAASELSYETRCYLLKSWGDLVPLQREDWDAAKALYLQALDESKKIGRDNSCAAESLSRLALVDGLRNDRMAAGPYVEEALRLGDKLGTSEKARIIAGLSSVSRSLGDLTDADAYLRQSIELFSKLDPNGLDVANLWLQRATIAFYRDKLIDTEIYSRRALQINLKLAPNSSQTAASLEMLGIVAWHRQDFKRAEELLKQSVKINHLAAPGSFFLARSLTNLAIVLRSRGKLDVAEKYLKAALPIAKKTYPQMVAEVMDNLGSILKLRGKLSAAQRYYEQAAAMEERYPKSFQFADKLIDLGRIARMRGQFDQAEHHFDRARQILERTAPASGWLAEVLAALGGIARRKGSMDEAAKYYERALSALEGHTGQLGGSSDLRAEYRANHENYYREYTDLLLLQGNPALALEVLERSRARTLLEILVGAQVDIHSGVDRELISKESSLQEEIKFKSERRVHLLTEKQSEDQVKAVEKEISTLTSEYQDVEAQIRSSSPAYSALTQPQPLSAKEIQDQLLDPDTLLLEYSLSEESSHVFVVSANSLVAYDLPKRAVIEGAARRMYELLTARNRRIHEEKTAERTGRIGRADAGYGQAAARLSRMVLGPIAKNLAGKRLLIVSDGALHYVPFAALPVHEAGKETVPLIAQHEILNLPSASVLAVLRREREGRQPAAKTVAVFADPVFDAGDARVKRPALDESRNSSEVAPGDSETKSADAAQVNSQDHGGLVFVDGEESLELAHLTRSAADVGWRRTRGGGVYLPRLQSTRREADAIVSATPAGQSLEVLDFKANRTTATSGDLANYRVVHFATHALLNSKHPELSGLVLSLVDERGRPQSGFLGLEDIYNLNLPAELVVLSACETALGKDIEGEGMVGLTRGFMYAGASRVMASLWKIDDRATADQMKYFYRAMVGEGMRPAAALRAAQLKMRKNPRWSSPYFWAAFQIQGEWK